MKLLFQKIYRERKICLTTVETHLVHEWVNNPTFDEFCFTIIGRADITGSKGDVGINAVLTVSKSLRMLPALPDERTLALLATYCNLKRTSRISTTAGAAHEW